MSSPPTGEGARAGGERLLLVDDDEAFCKALGGALKRRGHEVAAAHRYDDALALAEAFEPTRAIVDLRMPGRGGLELVAALSSAHPELRIVVLTGYGSIATAVEAIKLGAVHYLTKPAEVSEILAAFERTAPSADAEPSDGPMSLDDVEWEHLQQVLTAAGGNVSEAARRLGMHRRTLQRKLARRR